MNHSAAHHELNIRITVQGGGSETGDTPAHYKGHQHPINTTVCSKSERSSWVGPEFLPDPAEQIN